MMKNLTFSREEKIILACLRDDVQKSIRIRELYSHDCDDTLWRVANQNKIAPIVAHALMDAFDADKIPSRWVLAHQVNVARISAYLDELERVAGALSSKGVRLIVVENAAIAKFIYPCPGCFSFGDLDLLVRNDQLTLAHRVLVSIGYTTRQGSGRNKDIPDLSDGRYEYKRTLGQELSLRLNVQPSLIARRWFNADRESPLEVLFERSVSIPESAALMLHPVDNLFQLALHNACHSYVRKPGILLHLDIERYLKRTDMDWNHFVRLVERYKVRTAFYFSLIIPKHLFNTPVPDHVLNLLRPSSWKEKVITRWLIKEGFFENDWKKSRFELMLITLLLYDDLWSFWRAIFPDEKWMQSRYGKGIMIIHYIKRLSELFLTSKR